jgi:hypothetical protein
MAATVGRGAGVLKREYVVGMWLQGCAIVCGLSHHESRQRPLLIGLAGREV